MKRWEVEGGVALLIAPRRLDRQLLSLTCKLPLLLLCMRADLEINYYRLCQTQAIIAALNGHAANRKFSALVSHNLRTSGRLNGPSSSPPRFLHDVNVTLAMARVPARFSAFPGSRRAFPEKVVPDMLHRAARGLSTSPRSYVRHAVRPDIDAESSAVRYIGRFTPINACHSMLNVTAGRATRAHQLLRDGESLCESSSTSVAFSQLAKRAPFRPAVEARCRQIRSSNGRLAKMPSG